MGYLLNSFRAGISDENAKGLKGSFKFGYGLDIHERNDSFTNEFAMLPITPSGMNDLVRWMVPATDGSLYCFGSSGSIWAISGNTGDPAPTFVKNDENGAIKGATQFQTSDGNNYLVWTTNTSLAVKPLVGTGVTPWNDATQDFKTLLDPATFHTLQVASGNLIIANSNFLSTLDYNSNFTLAALNIIPGNVINALEERDDYVIIGSSRKDSSETGYLWSWIVTALNWVQKKRVPAKGVNALISSEFPLLQAGTAGEIFPADFVNIMPLATIPGGGQVNPGGTTIVKTMAAFGVYGGTYPGIWTYGRRNKNRPVALNYPYRLSPTVAGSTITEIGAICMMNGILYASSQTTGGDGTTPVYVLDQLSTTTMAMAEYESLEFDGETRDIQHWYKNITVGMAALPTGCSISCKFKMNKETNWEYALLSDGSTTFSLTGAIFAEFQSDKPGFVYEVAVESNPFGGTAPEIYSITTDIGGAYGHQ